MSTDPRESSSYSVIPRIRYNTVGGINGPLVILENVRSYLMMGMFGMGLTCWIGQIPQVQGDCVAYPARWHGARW